MRIKFLQMNEALRALVYEQSGQDLIEYALVVALIAFGAVLGMQGLASSINTAFNNIGTSLNGYI